jgi:hypothetical protein
MNGYELSRNWFDWAFENPELINPNHTAIYFYVIDQCNRLGWKDKFGLPSQMAMDALGIKKHETFFRYFNDLVDWGFIGMVQKSKNQYTANIITLKSAIPKKGTALEKAILGHTEKQTEGMGVGISSIDKPITLNLKPETNNIDEPKLKFQKPTQLEISNFLLEKYPDANIQGAINFAEKFWNSYENKDWKINKVKMKNWKLAISNWSETLQKDLFPTLLNQPKTREQEFQDSKVGKLMQVSQEADELIRQMFKDKKENESANSN